MLTNPLAWSSYPAYGLHGWVGPEGNEQWEWVKLALPFFLGAAGCLVMDAVIFGQFWLFGEGRGVIIKTEILVDGDDDDDDSSGDAGQTGRTTMRRTSGLTDDGSVREDDDDDDDDEMESAPRTRGRKQSRTRWTKATGWMRGWVPSPSPTPGPISAPAISRTRHASHGRERERTLLLERTRSLGEGVQVRETVYGGV